MNRVLIWFPSSRALLADVLFSLSSCPEVWTNRLFDEKGDVRDAAQYAIENGYMEKSFRPNLAFGERWCPPPASIYSYPDRYGEPFLPVRPSTPGDLEFIVLNLMEFEGFDGFMFSEKVDIDKLQSAMENGCGMGIGEWMLSRYQEVCSLAPFSAWFGHPDWDCEDSILLLSKNSLILEKVVETATSKGEEYFKDSPEEGGDLIRSIYQGERSGLWFADLEEEVTKFY